MATFVLTSQLFVLPVVCLARENCNFYSESKLYSTSFVYSLLFYNEIQWSIKYRSVVWLIRQVDKGFVNLSKLILFLLHSRENQLQVVHVEFYSICDAVQSLYEFFLVFAGKILCRRNYLGPVQITAEILCLFLVSPRRARRSLSDRWKMQWRR